jgi:hypothetical protein
MWLYMIILWNVDAFEPQCLAIIVTNIGVSGIICMWKSCGIFVLPNTLKVVSK